MMLWLLRVVAASTSTAVYRSLRPQQNFTAFPPQGAIYPTAGAELAFHVTTIIQFSFFIHAQLMHSSDMPLDKLATGVADALDIKSRCVAVMSVHNAAALGGKLHLPKLLTFEWFTGGSGWKLGTLHTLHTTVCTYVNTFLTTQIWR